MQLTKMELISKAQNNFNKLVSLLAEISYKHPDFNHLDIGAAPGAAYLIPGIFCQNVLWNTCHSKNSNGAIYENKCICNKL